jgi:hypothetical protein
MIECICCHNIKKCIAGFYSLNESSLELRFDESNNYHNASTFFMNSTNFPWLKKEDIFSYGNIKWSNSDLPIFKYNICEDCINTNIEKRKIYFFNRNNLTYPCKVNCCGKIITNPDEAEKMLEFYEYSNFPYRSSWETTDPSEDPLYWNSDIFPFENKKIHMKNMNVVILCGECLLPYRSIVTRENSISEIEKNNAWSAFHGYIHDDDFYYNIKPIYYLNFDDNVYIEENKIRINIVKDNMRRVKILNKDILIYFAKKNLNILKKLYFIPKDIYNHILKFI